MLDYPPKKEVPPLGAMSWKTIMNKEEAYEELRVRIITNGVVPGEILKEKDLMAQLAIGRSPLREILFRLQEENLIKPLPRLGYMVTTVDIFEVRDLVELEGVAGAPERLCEYALHHGLHHGRPGFV